MQCYISINIGKNDVYYRLVILAVLFNCCETCRTS